MWKAAAICLYIDGKNVDTQKTYCTPCSVGWDQIYRGSNSVFGGGTAGAAWFKYASLPAGQSPTFSNLSVLCDLPPKAWITGIEVTR